jgi:hypothetical protein
MDETHGSSWCFASRETSRSDGLPPAANDHDRRLVEGQVRYDRTVAPDRLNRIAIGNVGEAVMPLTFDDVDRAILVAAHDCYSHGFKVREHFFKLRNFTVAVRVRDGMLLQTGPASRTPGVTACPAGMDAASISIVCLVPNLSAGNAGAAIDAAAQQVRERER